MRPNTHEFKNIVVVIAVYFMRLMGDRGAFFGSPLRALENNRSTGDREVVVPLCPPH